MAITAISCRRHDSFTPTVLGSRLAVYELKDDEYLPLGDNTGFSLDGRYFGAVNQGNVVGPAFAVYWPFRFTLGPGPVNDITRARCSSRRLVHDTGTRHRNSSAQG